MALNFAELLKSSPHELRICGPKHAKQIDDDNGINDLVYRMYSLNFMEVSRTSLNALSIKIKELENLTQLMLYDNKLVTLPKEIGLLRKLKTLDLSNNQLVSLPSEMSQLSDLQSLNIINNKIDSLPKDLSKWSNLIVIKFSHNRFQRFPPGLCSETFKQHLTEIHAADNEIQDLPMDIHHLAALRHLDLSNNKVEFVPGELAECVKIKTLALQGNPIKDVRLHKLAEKNPTKQILQYVAKSCPKGGQAGKGAGKGGKGNRKKTVSSSSNKSGDSKEDGDGADENTASVEDQVEASSEQIRQTITRKGPEIIGEIDILAVHPDAWFIIEAESAILDDRKIVACIVRNLTFEDEKAVKKFLTLQTNLHDSPVCGKRELATIATHDLAKVEARVRLCKMLPHKIQIVPLNRGNKQMTGIELYRMLNAEAEAYRKEKKRNNYSGIHKYLYLLKGKSHYPAVVDGSGKVITLPPLTNAEHTKITTETRDVLVEVTGSKTPNCKKVIDTLLYEMLKQGIVSISADSQQPLPKLQVEPVRVVRAEEDNKLFVVYPSKVDLPFDDVKIERKV